jgi:hypothetical protein
MQPHANVLRGATQHAGTLPSLAPVVRGPTQRSTRMIQQWNGTTQELERLRQAVEANCGCARPPEAPGPACAAHSLLIRQATLDHLLFVYRTRSSYLVREFATG